MRILLLNHFVPPDPAPTARLLGDLATIFRAAGWEVVSLGAAAGYHGRPRGWRRLLSDGMAHLKLFWKGLRAGPCDWVICLSDPPGLPFTAALLARMKGAKLGHWAMDVYPQVAVALGALPEGFVTRQVGRAMRWGYRKCDPLIALDEDMREVIENTSGRKVGVIPPWPPAVTTQKPTLPTESIESRIWLYSGNLGRAHLYRELLETQRLLEQSGSGWHLIFQGGGPCRAAAQAEATSLKLEHCSWLPYAPDDTLLESLQQADVLIATQNPVTNGLLWPSKLALMRLLDQPILWLGPAEGQIARDLKEESHGTFAPGQAQAMAQWLINLPDRETRLPREVVAEKVENQRRTGMEKWVELLMKARSGGGA